MEPAINLYSPNEKSELIRENYQEILSVLAAHQIALWEYDIITGKCSFSELGQEAINSFIRESPDLILMDIRMPVMDGIQATEKDSYDFSDRAYYCSDCVCFLYRTATGYSSRM